MPHHSARPVRPTIQRPTYRQQWVNPGPPQVVRPGSGCVADPGQLTVSWPATKANRYGPAGAVSVPSVQRIGYVPGGLVFVAVVVQCGAPATPEVARVCPSTNPLIVADSGGLRVPAGRDCGSAVTVSFASAT